MGKGVSGLEGSVVLVTGGTPKVEGIGEWNMDVSIALNEVTEFGDTWKYNVAGIRSATGSFMGNGRTDGTVQTHLRNAALGGSVLQVRLYEGTANYWSGSVLMTGIGRATNVQGKLDTTYNFEAQGPLTYT